MSSDISIVELDLPLPAIPVTAQIPCFSANLNVQLPFGISLGTYVGPDTPLTGCNEVESLINQLMSLMGGLQPLFLILDVLLAVLACIQAIPDSITSLSPAPILECIDGLITSLIALLCALYPPFAYPALIQSVVEFLVSAVQCVRDSLNPICDAINRIENLTILVNTDPQLKALESILGEASVNLECRVNGMSSAIEGICSLIEIVNVFIGVLNDIVGTEVLPVLPCPAIAPGTPCEEVIESLDALLAALNAILSLIEILPCDEDNPPI